MGNWNPAVLAINGYQKFISPYKGFCCAHRVVTGDVSCSEYVKRLIQQKGLFSSLSDIRQRFSDCKASAICLNEMGEDGLDKREDEEKQEGSCLPDTACVACDLGAAIPSGCGEVSVGGAGSVVAGGCDGCACTPF